jgi:hypothetical protein
MPQITMILSNPVLLWECELDHTDSDKPQLCCLGSDSMAALGLVLGPTFQRLTWADVGCAH